MKKINVIILLISINMAMLLLSCGNDDEYKELLSPIIDADLPVKAYVGKEISFLVMHSVYNGCGQFSRHETSISNKNVYVNFYAKYPENKPCTDAFEVRETHYKFIPSEIGAYNFYFKTGSDYIEKSIIVN